jgi:hypothetical protein
MPVEKVYITGIGFRPKSDSGGGGGGLTQEQIQDMLSSFLVAGSNISLTYNDGANTLTITGADASLNLDGGNAASVGSALPAIDGGGA